MKKENDIGKVAYAKFGKFHGQRGIIVGETVINGVERHLIKLQNGLIIPKKKKNVILFGGVQNDNPKKK